MKANPKRMTSPGPGDEEEEAESVVSKFNVANCGRKVRE